MTYISWTESEENDVRDAEQWALDLLRKVMEQNGWTAEQMSVRAGHCADWGMQILNGQKPLNLQDCWQLALSLGLSLKEFFLIYDDESK